MPKAVKPVNVMQHTFSVANLAQFPHSKCKYIKKKIDHIVYKWFKLQLLGFGVMFIAWKVYPSVFEM